jgi:hypothetical protein
MSPIVTLPPDTSLDYVCRTDFLYRTSKGRYYRIITTHAQNQITIFKYRENALKVKSLVRKEVVTPTDPRYAGMRLGAIKLFDEIKDLERPIMEPKNDGSLRK